MAKFTLSIDCDNAAFGEDKAREVSRILFELAASISPGLMDDDDGKLRDVNGNTVGRWSYDGEV